MTVTLALTDERAADEHSKPMVLVFICSDPRFNVDGGREDEIRAFYEEQGYEVVFVEVAATINWLAHPEECSHLLRMARPFLRKAVIVIAEAHMTCIGLRDMVLEATGVPMEDHEERQRHRDDLRLLMPRVAGELYSLGNFGAEIIARLYHMGGGVEQVATLPACT